MMRRLKHKNIANLHFVYEDEEKIHLVMDFIEGEPLIDVMVREDKIPDATCAKITYQLLEIIQHMNNCGIGHRDIKLENVLISKDGSAKLFDFGLAADATHGFPAGPIMGSPGYIAPEMLWSEPCGFPVDMFSLGAMMYAALFGKMPFKGST